MLDDVLASLAAFAGMWNEIDGARPGMALRRHRPPRSSGRSSFSASTGSLVGDAEHDGDGARAADVGRRLEVLLAANESLVAYRRQHRSDVALGPALELLLRDRDNPRGLRDVIERLAEHVADVGWYEGTAAVSRLVGS